MDISINPGLMLRILYYVAWVIFIGLCIEAGGFIFNGILMMFTEPENTGRFWKLIDLTALYRFDRGHFMVIILQICIVAIVKVIIFYLIIHVLHNKKFDMARPFSRDMGRFLLTIAYLTLLIGGFSLAGAKYAAWLVSQGVEMPALADMKMSGADVWLFMSVTLFIIAHIFKRGIELQSENELTV